MEFKNKYIHGAFHLKKIQRLAAVLKIIFTPVALLFLAVFTYQSQAVLFQLMTSANIVQLCMSVLLWISLHFLMPLLAMVIFNCRTLSLSYRESLMIYANRLPARYIPGGIWHTLARAFDYHQTGISKKNTMGYIILENSLSLSVALLLGSVLIMLGDKAEVQKSILIMSMSVGLLTIIFTPLFINRYFSDISVINYIFHISTIVRSLVILCIFWLLAGLSFSIYVSAFVNILQNYSYADVSGTYILSWAAGFVALFAPQGLGVMEVVAANILNSPVGIGAIVLLVLGFRGIILCADIFMWLFIKIMKSKL